MLGWFYAGEGGGPTEIQGDRSAESSYWQQQERDGTHGVVQGLESYEGGSMTAEAEAEPKCCSRIVC